MSKTSNGASKKEDLVVTPGGPRSKAQVHTVKPGDAVRVESGRAAVVSRGQVAVSQQEGFGAIGEDMVLTPGGFRHRSLVQKVGRGQALQIVDSRAQLVKLATRAVIDLPELDVQAQSVPALGSGWIAYAYWNNGTGNSITSFQTTWQVPPAPRTNSGQTIFLFNGIQNYGNNYGILQPVLQWGPSAAGGGSYWSVASWYVTSGGQAFHTNLVRVNVGDTLVGLMTLTGQVNNAFSYISEFQGIAGTSLPVQNIAELLWCNETLEAYGVNQCSDYPWADGTQFGSINIQTSGATPVLNWTPVNSVTDCGQHVQVISNANPQGSVAIFYTTFSTSQFTPVYAQGSPGKGIGGYDLKSAADRVFAFDYNSSGKLDHLVLYRPGTGTIWILRNTGGQFSPIYAQGAPGGGIGGYDLKSAADRVFAFDNDSSGRLDHLALYRPGTGAIWILANSGGLFSPVYAQGDPGKGIGGYDLKSKADQAFAYDYDSSGRLDHLALYRPGTGTIWILRKQ